MLDITAIEDALRDWVVLIVPTMNVIFAHANAPRPQSAYVLINLLQSTPHGIEEHDYTLLGDDSVDVEYSNLEELFVSINVYYTGAFGFATKLKDSLGRVTIQEQLWGDSLGYIRAGDVRDIPEEVNKRWEERAQFDCFFHTRSSDDNENIETIQQVEITNEIDNTTVIIEKP